MFSLLPEKFQPDAVVDNVAYYPDGTYSLVQGSQVGAFTPTEAEPGPYSVPLAIVGPTDLESSNTLSGVRIVRGIVATFELTNTYHFGPTFGWYERDIPVFVAISVGRENQSQIIPRDVLAARDAILAPVHEILNQASTATSRFEVVLKYPGDIKLYSGDGIQVTVRIGDNYVEGNYSNTNYAVNYSLFSKFN